MTKVPPLPYRVVIRKLRRMGFVLRRSTGGSHEIWWHKEKKKTCVVPHHQEVKSGTVRSIIDQIGISTKEFLDS